VVSGTAIINRTTTAVKAGNFTQAATTFKSFDEYWEGVEDGVKVKFPALYRKIEENMDTVSHGLRGNKPDSTKVLSALQALSTDLAEYTSSL